MKNLFVSIFTLPLHSQTEREFSSAGSEHLPYKQRVGGSNPSTPTQRREIGFPISFFCLLLAREQALVNQFPKIFAFANSSQLEVGGVGIK